MNIHLSGRLYPTVDFQKSENAEHRDHRSQNGDHSEGRRRGVSVSQISHFECGRSPIKVVTLEQLARGFHCSIVTLRPPGLPLPKSPASTIETGLASGAARPRPAPVRPALDPPQDGQAAPFRAAAGDYFGAGVVRAPWLVSCFPAVSQLEIWETNAPHSVG